MTMRLCNFRHTLDGHVLLRNRNAKAGAGHNVFRILGGERRTVVSCGVGQFDDLHSFKCCQVDSCNAWCIVAIDKEPAPIGDPVRSARAQDGEHHPRE